MLELVAAAADGDPVVDDGAVVELADVVNGAVEEVLERLACVVDTGAICTMLADPDCNTRVAVRVL